MIADLNNKNMLTTGQVARLLHIHPNTVRRWSNCGILKSYRISRRGDRRFRREDVASLFESRLFDCGTGNVDTKDKLTVCI